jgi:uncharacterized protein
MGKKFAKIAFTPLVQRQQALHGSRSMYERVEQSGAPGDRLTSDEREFLRARDSFYIASTSETGWPYIQHRGGLPGFVHVLDDQTIAFRGNKQYISVGNLQHDNRVALFFMDYPNQTRLKILGHAEIREGVEAEKLTQQLRTPEEKSPIERIIVVHIDAFDWNCPQHITPRYTRAEIEGFIELTRNRVAELETENKHLRAQLDARLNA